MTGTLKRALQFSADGEHRLLRRGVYPERQRVAPRNDTWFTRAPAFRNLGAGGRWWWVCPIYLARSLAQAFLAAEGVALKKKALIASK